MIGTCSSHLGLAQGGADGHCMSLTRTKYHKKQKLIKEEKATSEKRRRRRIKDEDEEKEFGKENQMWRNLDGGVNLKERTTGEECGNERKNKIKEEKTTSEKRRERIIKDTDEDKEFGKENQMWRDLMNCYMDIFGKSFDFSICSDFLDRFFSKSKFF